jgi:Ca2+-binding EF-hand superfamily protein
MCIVQIPLQPNQGLNDVQIDLVRPVDDHTVTHSADKGFPGLAGDIELDGADRYPIYLHEDTSNLEGDSATNYLWETADSELFTRLETAKQGKITKADGKMSRNDLKAALDHGGLTPQERVIAEYLLENFDSITTSRHIRSEDLKRHVTGIELSAEEDIPLAGLKSFVDDKQASSFFGFIKHDKDFRNLVNGSSISRDELEQGQDSSDFTPAQQEAIGFLLQHLDAVGGQDGRIQEKELQTFVSSVEGATLSRNMATHRPVLQEIADNKSLFNDISGTSFFTNTITEAELREATVSDRFSAEQKAAIGFIQEHFNFFAKGDGKISRSDLQATLGYDLTALERALSETQYAGTVASQAPRVAALSTSEIERFALKVDELDTADDRGPRFGFISLDRGEPGYAPYDNRSNFGDPFSLFGNKNAEADGYLSREDLSRAIRDNNFTPDEQSLALLLLENFSAISGNRSTISVDQIAMYLGSF